MELLNQKDYAKSVEEFSRVCPNCRSEDVEQHEGYVACDDCGATWEDDIEVVGYKKLSAPDKTLSAQEYVKQDGIVCPACGSKAIQSCVGRGPQMDGPEIWAEIECDDCGATWTDVFKLAGYENLEIPTPTKE